MGLGSSFKKLVKKAGGGSKVLAVVAPYASFYNKTGRTALADTWGKVAKPFVSSFSPAAGGVFSAVVDRIGTQPSPLVLPPEQGNSGDGGGAYGYGQGSSGSGSSFSMGSIVAIGAGVVGLLVVVFLLMRGKR